VIILGRKLLLLGFLLSCSINVVAQQETSIDTLNVKLHTASTDDDTFHFLEEIYYYWLNNNYDSADVYAEKYYEFANQVGDLKKVSIGLNYIGIVFDYREDVATASEYYNNALKIRREIGDKRLIGNSLSNIGALYYHAGDYTKASNYYYEALAIREEIQDSSGLSQSYNNLGILLKNQGETVLALDYYLRSAQLKKAIGREYSAMFTMMNIGSLYIQMEEYDNAISISKEALLIAETYQDHSSIGALQLNIGSALSSLNKFKEAEELLNKGIEELRKVGESSHEIEGYVMLANNYLKKGDYSEAEQAIESISRREQEILEPTIEQKFYQTAVNVFSAKKDYRKAFEYKVKEGVIKDSLFNKNTKNALLELETKYKLSEREQELEILSTENALKVVQVSKANIVRNYTIFLALLLVVVLIVMYKNRLIRERLNQKLEKNLAEKEILMKEIHHRVKNNLQIISSLLNIQSRQTMDESTSLVLKESKNRVQSMALIHQSLYQKENITSVRIEEYVNKLVQTLTNSFGIEDRINMSVDIQDIELDVDTTIPLGLIINELVTNAVKYAFDDVEKGELSITLKERDHTLILQITDNGKGFNLEDTSASFGMNLVEMLSTKLEAELSVENKNGSCIQLVIKKYRKGHE
tara:strand:- start:12250 stop:14175 length:1926 start_codon:yes stop_codon:yes gene_type:complete